MKVLALDSATTACSAAVWIDGTTVAHELRVAPRGQAELLLPLVERVRAAAGLRFAEFDRFAVTVGPGHFTGLRAGLAAARGLALAAGRPLIGVTTLTALAAAIPAHERAGAVVLVALDSKRAEPYVQAFDAELRPLDAPAAVAVETYAAAWSSAAARTPLIVAGDAADTLARALAARGATAVRSVPISAPDAAVVASIAAEMRVHSAPPAPLYIHPVETTAPRARQRSVPPGVDG